jgi:microcystin degradation protein MlrC
MVRIAIGAMMQETNDFSPVQTTREVFQQVLRGEAILEHEPHPPPAEVLAFVDELSRWEELVEFVPLATITAMSSGRMTEECHEWARSEILEPLRAAGSVDGVLLALHGAMVAVGEDDPEGALLADVREIVGPGVPICASLDLHVHLTRRMAAVADALCIYHKIPHIDMVETGQRTARAMRRILDGARPTANYIKLPLHLPVERVNTEAGAEDVAGGKYAAFPPWVSRHVMALEEDEPWCLGAGLATTQPWLNVEDLGAAFLIIADESVPGGAEAGKTKAEELAAMLWEAREEYMPVGQSLLSVEEAVAQAHSHTASGGAFVAIGDGADATTSGAPGDSTWLLQELLRYSWPAERPALVTVVSPSAVAAAAEAGLGGRLDGLPIGGVLDNVYAEPLVVTAVVEALFDGSCRIVMLSRFVALVSLTWTASLSQTTSSGGIARGSILSCRSARRCGCSGRRAAPTPGCA